MSKILKKDQKYKNFTVTKYLPLPEIKNTLIELVHDKTKAQVIHLQNDDEENLFSLSFKTYPLSSNGAPHILEHTVLCGSKKFPVKDPFFSMLRRSVNTFMNAMTGEDFTCYPASSLVEKDFYNLFEVYIDAVFNPSLKELSFMQEGHRLEFKEPNNPKSSLTRKGVVYNEMKGAMASSDSRLMEEIKKNLMPDLPYSYNSGGEPKIIPQITYEQLKEFHRTYYHPGHCLFFFYGNIPLEKHLDFIEEHALNNIEKPKDLPIIKLQKRFNSPIEKEIKYPISENEDDKNKDIISFSWLTCPIANQEDVIAITLLESILMDTDASPLKHALLKSNLTTQVYSFIDSEINELPWVIVCKGTDKKNKHKLFEIIENTLRDLVKNKINKKLIDASLHQLEFSRSEIVRSRSPYGLILFFRSALLKQHKCEPENGLMIHSLFESINNKLKDPDYLPSVIEKYLLNNKHRLDLTLIPDKNLEKEERQDEIDELEKIKSKLSEAETKKIIENTQKLKDFQIAQAKQSSDCLPKIHINEIPKTVKDFTLSEEKWKNFNIYHHDCFTNQIVYVNLLFDMPKLSDEELFLSSLFSSLLTEIGSNQRSYEENLQMIHSYTGGIASSMELNISSKDIKTCSPSFVIGGKALYKNTDKLISLIIDAITSPNWSNKDRIKELLLQQYTFIQNSLVNNAMGYAVSLSFAGMDIPSYINYKWHGLDYYHQLQKIVNNIDNELPQLIESLTALQNKIFTYNNLDLVISCCKNHFKTMKDNNFYGLDALEPKKITSWENNFTFKNVESQGRIIPSPVSFTSIAYDTINYYHPDAPYLFVGSSLFEHIVLHQKIREQGGAYGSGANFFPLQGKFYFFAFRDPNLASSVEACHIAQDEIAKGLFTDEELEEAKLSIIQSLDKPIFPGGRAITGYVWKRKGLTKKIRQEFRKKILEAKKEDIEKAVKEHLISKRGKETVVSFANKSLLENENKKFIAANMKELNIIPV